MLKKFFILNCCMMTAIMSFYSSITVAGRIENAQWEELKSQGYIFVETEEFHRVFAILNEEAELNFDNKIEAKSLIERAVPKEELESRLGQPFQRDSWFLSKEFSGPFSPEIVNKAFESVIEIWQDILDRIEVPYTTCEAMGFHRYLSVYPGEGLGEHKDAGLITILASTQSLEGFIKDSWQEIRIPEGHVMVFLGNLLNLFDSQYHCLLHRVPQVKNGKKLSLNVVIDPAGTDLIILNGQTTQYKVSAYHEAYFSTEAGIYAKFLENLRL